MTKSSVAPVDSPVRRTVMSGARLDSGIYLIVLDGGQEVEATDESVAMAASRALKQQQPITAALEAREHKRPLLVEVGPWVEPETTTAVATRASTAVAPSTHLPTGLIIDPDQLSSQLKAMAKGYNVLSPAIAVSQMAPGFGANLAIVQIDSTVVFEENAQGEPTSGSGPDCYWSKSIHGSSHKRSLNKSGLQKIAQAIGIQWDHRQCRRVDDGRERNLWIWQYVGYVRTHDGQLQTVSGSRELDLRDGAAETAGMTPKQLQKQRAMGNQMCETKAMQRAIRTFVRQAYTVDELKKPFLVVRFSFTPDMSDPEIKKLVTQNAMAGVGALYQPPAGSVLPALPSPPEADDIAETMTSDAPAEKPSRQVGSAPPPPTDPFANTGAADELPIGQARVAEVQKKPGKNKQGNPWMLYTVTLSNGEVATTFSESMHKVIDAAHASKAPVKYTTEENPGYNDKLTSIEIVDSRQGNLPMGEGLY